MRFIVLAFVTLMTFISPAFGTGFEQAVERYKAKEFQSAFAEFYELATDEHASAQVNLAIMFAKGQGVPQNDAHALYWAWRASFSGASQAIPIIDYLTHKTIEADRVEIAKNLRFSYAARFKSGDETAALKMARTFNEVDKPRDPNLAYKWFTVAAAKDVQYAMALRETLALEILPEDRSRLQKDATETINEWCRYRNGDRAICTNILLSADS